VIDLMQVLRESLGASAGKAKRAADAHAAAKKPAAKKAAATKTTAKKTRHTVGR